MQLPAIPGDGKEALFLGALLEQQSGWLSPVPQQAGLSSSLDFTSPTVKWDEGATLWGRVPANDATQQISMEGSHF